MSLVTCPTRLLFFPSKCLVAFVGCTELLFWFFFLHLVGSTGFFLRFVPSLRLWLLLFDGFLKHVFIRMVF